MKTPTYDLEERTARFGEGVIEFCLTLPLNPVTLTHHRATGRSRNQRWGELLRSGRGRIEEGLSPQIAICRKESKETKYWLRMIAKAAPAQKTPAREL